MFSFRSVDLEEIDVFWGPGEEDEEMSVCMWMDAPVILHAGSLYLRKTLRRTDM